MPDIDLLDLSVYQSRAANRPKPDDWVEPDDAYQHDEKLALFLAHNAANYFTDTSEYQPYYNKSYPYPLAMFRFHSGYCVDNKAAGNWAYHRSALASGKTRVLFAYAVYIPGQNNVIMNGLRSVFGAKCPTNRLVLSVDMESGAGFAGPGNHSADANRLAGMFADYTGAWPRVEPYANVPDFGGCWPTVDPRIVHHRHIARYDDAAPSLPHYPWQYYGALPYPSPPGAPRSCAPFGAYVDMNVIYDTIDNIEASYGITKPTPPIPPTPPEEDDMSCMLLTVSPDTVPPNTTAPGTFLYSPEGRSYVPVLIGDGLHGVSNGESFKAGGAKVGGSITYAQHLVLLAETVQTNP